MGNVDDLITVFISRLGDLSAGASRLLIYGSDYTDRYKLSKIIKELRDFTVSLDNDVIIHGILSANYLYLLIASSYYLTDDIDKAFGRSFDVFDDDTCSGFDILIKYIIHGYILKNSIKLSTDPLGVIIREILDTLLTYKEYCDVAIVKIIDLAHGLRGFVYEFGTPRQLLLGDISTALIFNRVKAFNKNYTVKGYLEHII